jgi:hypothetical protein
LSADDSSREACGEDQFHNADADGASNLLSVSPFGDSAPKPVARLTSLVETLRPRTAGFGVLTRIAAQMGGTGECAFEM